jgi:hypothetical protein
MDARLRNTTRYLAAAAYLDPAFRDRALGSLLDQRHRSVAPSVGGFDLVPVLRHCQHARSLLTVRDAAVTAMLALALLFGFTGVFPWIAVLAALGVLASHPIGPVAARRSTGRLLVTAGAAGIALMGAGIGFAALVDSSSSSYEEESSGVAWLGPVMLLAAAGTVLAYRMRVYRILAERLRPGAVHPEAGPSTRMGEVDAAQKGNLTLYSGENPFIGAGHLVRAWSIAAELDRRKGTYERELSQVDAVELHEYVGDRLEQMRFEAAPGMPVELDILDHVVAQGLLNQLHGTHPLLQDGRPRHHLDHDALHAIIRNPQSGARHYRWIVVGTGGAAVTDRHGNQVLPATDRDTTVSIFIHLAIEGRMLYTEFVVMALPPVRAAHRIVDELPKEAGPALLLTTLTKAPLQLARDLVAAPLRLVRGGLVALRTVKDPADYVVFDFGTEVSLRELGAEREITTFLEQLDAFKYAKLVEERLNNAVLDYLDLHDVDTTAYRQQVAAVINNGTVVNGGTFSGVAIGGQGAKVTAGEAA